MNNVCARRSGGSPAWPHADRLHCHSMERQAKRCVRDRNCSASRWTLAVKAASVGQSKFANADSCQIKRPYSSANPWKASDSLGIVQPHRAAHSQQVHAGSRASRKNVCACSREPQNDTGSACLLLRPACAARNNRHAVYSWPKAIAQRAAVNVLLPEADALKLDLFIVSKFQRDAMQGRFTTCMRPPTRRIGNAQRVRKRLRIAPLQRCRCIVANWSCRLFVLPMNEPERQLIRPVDQAS